MEEAPADVDELQRVLDASLASSGPHLRTAFSQDAQRASAAELVALLPPIFELHLAVVTPAGAPLVAPVDGLCFRGRVWVGLPPASVRARLVLRDPRVSASYASEAISFIVHGRFVPVELGDPMREAFDVLARRLYVAQYGEWFDAWLDERLRTEGAGPTGYLEPRVLFAKR